MTANPVYRWCNTCGGQSTSAGEFNCTCPQVGTVIPDTVAYQTQPYPGTPEVVIELRRIAAALEKAVKYVR